MQACTAFAGVLQSNSTLQELDLSCNALAPGEHGWLLHEAIKANQCALFISPAALPDQMTNGSISMQFDVVHTNATQLKDVLIESFVLQDDGST